MLSHNIVPKPPALTVQQCKLCVLNKLKSSDFTIVSFTLVNLSEKSGFLGEHLQLKIIINHDRAIKQIDFFAKFLPNTQAQLDFAVGCGAIKKEIFVYDQLFPRIQHTTNMLQACVPACYYTKDNFVLVFEDVTKNGYVPLPRYGHLDLDHVVVILKQLAKLHASSLVFEEHLSKLKKYRILDEYLEYFFETFYVNEPGHKGGQGLYAAIRGLETALTLFPEDNSKLSNAELIKNIAKASTHIFELVKPSTKYRNVVCHGDLWCTNIMMGYSNHKPIDCKFLDFQTARYLPPAHDFMSFIFLTTTRELRRQHFKDLQNLYYTELGILVGQQGYDLQSLISMEEFVGSCQEQKCFAVVQAVTYFQLTQVNTELIGEFMEDLEKWDYALYTDRSLLVRESCAKDPEYKQVLRDSLKDLRDLCEEMQ